MACETEGNAAGFQHTIAYTQHVRANNQQGCTPMIMMDDAKELARFGRPDAGKYQTHLKSTPEFDNNSLCPISASFVTQITQLSKLF